MEVNNQGLIRQQLGVNSCYDPTLKYDPHLSFFTRSRIYHKIGRKEHFTNSQLVKLNVRNLRETIGLQIFLRI